MKKVLLTFLITALICVGFAYIISIPKDKKVTEHSETLIECSVVERYYIKGIAKNKYLTIVDYNGFVYTIDDKLTYDNSEYEDKLSLKLVTLKYDDGEIITSILPLHEEVII